MLRSFGSTAATNLRVARSIACNVKRDESAIAVEAEERCQKQPGDLVWDLAIHVLAAVDWNAW
jgi:hypothetical protein